MRINRLFTALKSDSEKQKNIDIRLDKLLKLIRDLEEG